MLYDASGRHEAVAEELGCSYATDGLVVLGSEYAVDTGAWFSLAAPGAELPAVTHAPVDKALRFASLLRSVAKAGSRIHPVAPAV